MKDRLRNRRTWEARHHLRGKIMRIYHVDLGVDDGTSFYIMNLLGPLCGVPKVFLEVVEPTKGTVEIAIEWLGKEMP